MKYLEGGNLGNC